jgi:hypothetical protein
MISIISKTPRRRKELLLAKTTVKTRGQHQASKLGILMVLFIQTAAIIIHHHIAGHGHPSGTMG